MEDRTPDELEVGGDRIALRVTSEQSDGALLGAEVRIPAGGGPPALHRHAAFETYRMEAGELAFYIADEAGSVTRAVAGPGETVAIPGGREHTIRNESAREAAAFVVFAPGLGVERFMRAVADAADMDEVLAVAAAHDVEITRPLGEVG